MVARVLLLWGLLALGVPVLAEEPVPLAAYRGPVSGWPAPEVDEGVAWVELAALPEPDVAPMWTAETRLGRLLFFDPWLSGSGQISCASCHDPDLAWTDGRRVPFGHDRMPGTRNTPSLINVGYLDTLMWDGRADSLEQQAGLPLVSHVEMNARPDRVVARLERDPAYAEWFTDAFGDADITYPRIVAALGDFQRHLTTRRTPFDEFMEGRRNALDDQEIRGLHWFRTQGRCMNCHHGPLLTDQAFHNLGLNFYGRPLQDLGRHAISDEAGDVGRFRTPPLRGVAYTAPYMHNGMIPALRNVLLFYNKGGAHPPKGEEHRDDPLFPSTSDHLRPLHLSEAQLADLEAFLRAVSVKPNRLPMRFEQTLRDRARRRAHQAGSQPQ